MDTHVDFAYRRERPMNPVTQLPRHPRRGAFLNDDASLETVSRPIHLLKIDSSPRASKSNSIALTDAFVTAYTDALPSVTVDVMNVWDEKLPEFDNAAIDAKYKGVRRQRDERGRDGRVESHPGTGGAVQAGGPDRPRCSDVELCLSLQAEAADRPGVATQHAVHLRRRAVRSTSGNPKGDGYLYQRPGVQRRPANPAFPVRPPIRLCRVLAPFHRGARRSSIGG